MPFSIRFTPGASEDLDFYPVAHRRVIVDAIRLHLTHEADRESRRRKKLRDHPVAPWELRVGDFRVFYEFEGETGVKVLAIGRKVHNDLFIRGKRLQP